MADWPLNNRGNQMEWLLIAVAVVGFWLWKSNASQHKEAVSFQAADMADDWFRSHGVDPSTVRFATYDDPRIVQNFGATAIAGIGTKGSGQEFGFCIEVVPGRGVVAAAVIEPAGVATWHAKAAREAPLHGMKLMEALMSMADSHRQRHQPS